MFIGQVRSNESHGRNFATAEVVNLLTTDRVWKYDSVVIIADANVLADGFHRRRTKDENVAQQTFARVK